MVDFVTVTLWFYLCVLCSLCRCCVVVVSYCCRVVSPLMSSTTSWRPLLLPSSSRSTPSFALGASSHVRLPVLCLCLSILWCDPRRHGRKVDELRSVPSEPCHLPPSLVLFPGLPSHSPPLISVIFSLFTRSSSVVFAFSHSSAGSRLFLANIHGFFATDGKNFGSSYWME